MCGIRIHELTGYGFGIVFAIIIERKRKTSELRGEVVPKCAGVRVYSQFLRAALFSGSFLVAALSSGCASTRRAGEDGGGGIDAADASGSGGLFAEGAAGVSSADGGSADTSVDSGSVDPSSDGGRGAFPGFEHRAGTDGSVPEDASAPGDSGNGREEYLGCSSDGAISRIFLYRIDRSSSICTVVRIEQNFGIPDDPGPNCEPLALVGEPPQWCLASASASRDVAACEQWGVPGDAVEAIAVTGAFSVDTSGVDIDVELGFPGGGALPETVRFQAANCEVSCAADDCRAAATCTDLAYMDFGNFFPQSAMCPIDPAQPACASEDVGARVARSDDCLVQSCTAIGMSPWSHDFSSELVLLPDPFDGCEWPLVVDSVLDCGDRVEIAYSVIEPCESCDAPHPVWNILHLPNDPKPVHATATLRQEGNCSF